MNVQILRFVAAALVVHAHAVDFSTKFGTGSSFLRFGNFENIGAIGVDIFFVISGFIITRIAILNDNKSNDAYDFILKRIIRVVPLYFMISAPFILLAILKSDFNFTIFLSSVTFWPVWGGDFIFPYLFLGWTLNFEMLFYAAVFVAMLIGGAGYFIVVALYLALLAGSFFSDGALINYLGNPIILEFLMGVAIAMVTKRVAISRGFGWAALLGFLGAMSAIIWFGFGKISEAEFAVNGELSMERAVIFGIPSALLVFSAVILERISYGGRIRSYFITLGDASYSIYLSHTPLFYLFNKVLTYTSIKINSSVLIIICFILAMLFGQFVYVCLEKPVLDRMRKFRRGKPLTAANA